MSETYLLTEAPRESRLPLVLDSPHSGALFPPGFRSIASETQLKTGWDAFVEALWAGVVDVGGSLLAARYSRMFIDLNRAPDDIDPQLLREPLAGCRPSRYSERGMGLIRRYALPEVPIYEAPLDPQEVLARIRDYYEPYHRALRARLDALHAEFGAVWHVDCHSMKSVGNRMNVDAGAQRPDVVIGDDEGRTAEPGFVAAVEQGFRRLGYHVVRNVPYKGGHLVTGYADPGAGRHGLQIEINRALYMDEGRFEPNAGFARLRADLAAVAADMAAHIRGRLEA